MDELTELLAKQASHDLITRYAMAVNAWDLDAFVALFTPDGEWQRPGQPLLRGHDEIRALMASQPQPPHERTVRHVNGGILVEVRDEATTTAWSQTTVYEGPPVDRLPAPVAGPDLVVEYRDRIVRTELGWRLARRDTEVVFRAPEVADR